MYSLLQEYKYYQRWQIRTAVVCVHVAPSACVRVLTMHGHKQRWGQLVINKWCRGHLTEEARSRNWEEVREEDRARLARVRS